MPEYTSKTGDVLSYWQSKIFSRILRAIIVLGFVAYVPSMIVCIIYKVWAVAMLDTFVLGSLLLLYFRAKAKFRQRVLLFNIILYLLSVGLLISLGPVGAGWIWLFAFPILGTVLSGFRSFFTALVLNFLTLTLLGILIHFGILDKLLISKYSMESWTIISINFLCMNVLFCYPIGILVKEIRTALDKEKETQTLLRNERENLAEKNLDLLKTNNDLDNFIYTASHDLKAPISNIEGLIAQLQRVLKNRDDETELILDMLQRSSLRLNNTIKDLAEISKTHNNIEGTNIDRIFVNELVQDIVKDLLAENSDIQMDLQVPEIYFSRKNLRSILYNLISNSLKYASPERSLRICIRTSISEGYVLLEVEDNGLGMTEGYQNKIFKMFKRLHDHVEGSGLGLYILNRIVENSGGKIEVDSQLGKGSIFRVFLKQS